MRLTTIQCAKCKKPCTLFVRKFPLLHKTTFTVWCHGAEQSVVLTDADLAQTHRIEVTEAFKEEEKKWRS